jgi:ABC-type Fe3+/spermidine/putrescine transport system ATPase subunit
VCLIGASGCGKSTLHASWRGFERTSSGTAQMYGMPITGLAQARMVFKDYALFPWLAVA